MKEFSSLQERFMSKKIALAFAASCLTAVAAVVPVAASAQDLGSLTDLSSLSVSLFDGPQKQPSPSPSAAPSTSASAAPSTSTTAPSEPAPVVPGFGQTVLDYDPGSRGSMAYMDAAKELANRGDVRFVK